MEASMESSRTRSSTTLVGRLSCWRTRARAGVHGRRHVDAAGAAGRVCCRASLPLVQRARHAHSRRRRVAGEQGGRAFLSASGSAPVWTPRQGPEPTCLAYHMSRGAKAREPRRVRVAPALRSTWSSTCAALRNGTCWWRITLAWTTPGTRTACAARPWRPSWRRWTVRSRPSHVRVARGWEREREVAREGAAKLYN